MDISSLSIIELKQLLARVNHDLKMNKPTIKRIKQEKAPVLSEGAICNQYAIQYSGNKAVTPVQNGKLIADIQIQKDILDYLNNGGHIITAKPSNKLNSKALRGAKSGNRLARKNINPLSVVSYHKVSL
jgi:hypothetical protein